MFIEIGKYEFDLLRLTYLIYIHTTWVIHKFMSDQRFGRF